jgi:hypothetical protein
VYSIFDMGDPNGENKDTIDDNIGAFLATKALRLQEAPRG